MIRRRSCTVDDRPTPGRPQSGKTLPWQPVPRMPCLPVIKNNEQ
ncbi:hypothetical protein K788_0003581 [Paraburkholderia caribensis MBA4]|uniref:Uncharacterized protein n=1 Tax=Paraburkholderia caribensis MBA4 TaxID=1323664 RepID=A0A0P0R6N8_9BURK|nr:hypothetical protein K788_0003581 [Paraburkholderia caribensis MBA4]